MAKLAGAGGGSQSVGTSGILRGGSQTSEEGGGTASAVPAPVAAAMTGADAVHPNDPDGPGIGCIEY